MYITATLSSTDDFFQTSNGLMISETTNDLYNETLYDFVTSSGGLSWSRVITCNALALSASQWTSCFSQYNGGTYRYC